MILWEESEKLYQRTKFRRVDSILVKCDNCGDVRSVKYVTWKNQMRIMGNDLCASCRVTYNRTKYKKSYLNSDKDRAKSLSNTMKEKWSDENVRSKYVLNNGKRITKSEFIKKSELKHGDKYDYSNVNYIGYLRKVSIICPKHGVFYQSPAKHLSGYGCQKCGVDDTRLSLEEFINKSILIHEDKYVYDEVDYKNTNSKVLIKCKKHGPFLQSPNSHLSGRGCPRCSIIISSYHNEIYEYIKEIYNGKVYTNDRKELDGLEIDIFIPDKALAIEVNGLYWHSYDKIETIEEKTRHKNKFDKCVDKNINLFYIWEHLWRDKQEIIKSMIKSKLGLNDKIFARKCSIDYIDNRLFFDFINKNHLQGSIGSSVKIGLSYNDELVCVIGFNRHAKYEWEVSRFASLLGTTIVGGMSKLFNKFISDYKPTSIMTYASLDYSNGNSYKKIGFNVLGISKPGYFYYKNGEVFSRQQFQKHKLFNKLDKFDSNLSESQNMFNNGYRRCWNCGNIKLLKLL